MRKFLMFTAALLVTLPMVVSAQLSEQGQVVGYLQSVRGVPSNAQLDRMTHLILFQLYPTADGRGLITTWFSYNNTQIQDIMTRARARNVKVLIALGGAGGNTANFIPATTNANRPHFVNAVRDFVNRHGFDGVDLDWEGTAAQMNWRQYTDLAIDLKRAMPDKWITATLGADSPWSRFGNHFTTDAAVRRYFQENIWIIDAVQLMTYDMGGGIRTGQNQQIHWATQACANASQLVMNEWATFGQGQPGFCRSKLLIGVHSSQDPTEAAVRQKVRFARQNGFGGAILWEANSQNHLNWMQAETNLHGGHVRPNQQRTITASVTGGNGTITPSGAVQVANGGSRTFTFTPNAGFEVNQVLVNGTAVTVSGNTHTMTNVTANGTISVSFRQIPVLQRTITASVTGGNGTITPSGTVQVANGGSQTFNFAPNAGFVVNEVRVNSVVVNVSGNSHTMTNVTANGTITVSFRTNRTPTDIALSRTTFTTAEVAANTNIATISNTDADAGTYSYELVTGTGSTNNNRFAISGTNLRVGATALTAGTYSIRIRVTDSQSTQSPNWFERAFTITVTQQQHTITASVTGGNGTISPTGAVQVNNGANQTFTFTPNAGFEIDRVLVNGTAVTVSGNTHIIRNITANGTISVSFRMSALANGIDLADGRWRWVENIDAAGTGSSITLNSSARNIAFALRRGISNNANQVWTWAEIASYPRGDWTSVSGITITYTSNQPVTLVLQDNANWAESGRPFHIDLQASPTTARTATILLTDFIQIDEGWRGDMTNFAMSLRNRLEGVAIKPTAENVLATGSISSLIIHGLSVEPPVEVCVICGNAPCTCGSVSIAQRNAVKRYGILLPQNPITADFTEIRVITPAPSIAKVVIYDVLGNIVFNSEFCTSQSARWDLRNQAGRFVANGTYLVIAEVKDRSGKTHQYIAKLGVKR